MTDTELLRLFSEQGRASAFEELVRRHAALVYSAALRQLGGDRCLAEEVSQAVFTDAARKARALVGHPSFVGWLYTSTRFAAAKAVRDERRRRVRQQETEVVLAMKQPTDDGIWSVVEPILDEALGELTARDRDVLLLRFFENLRLAEVGARTGVSENAARMRVERAVERLRAVLAKRGVGATGVALGATLAERAVSAAPAELVARLAAVTSVPLPALGGSAALGTKVVTALVAGLLAAAAALVLWVSGGDSRASSPERAERPTSALAARIAGSGAWPALVAPAADGALHGRVVDARGRPVGGAIVSGTRQAALGAPATLPETTTAADGTFGFLGLPSGRYDISARASGMAPVQQRNVNVLGGVRIGWLELTLWEGGCHLAGRVLDAASGPIPGSTVHLEMRQRPGEPRRHLSLTVTADADGSYGVQLPCMPVSLTVSASGYAGALGFVDLRADERHDLRLEPAAVIAGTVVDPATGAPAAGAQVFIDTYADREQPRIDVATTEAHGRFRIGGLRAGAYRLRARKDDLVGASAQRFTVSAGSVIDGMLIELRPGLTIAGTVRLDGRPLPRARVSLTYARTGGNAAALMTGADERGAFVLRGLLPGEYTFVVSERSWGDGRRFEERISLRSSLTREVDLRETVVSGVVVTSSNRPAAGARLEAAAVPRNPFPGPVATSDAAGRFVLRGLRPSEQWIYAAHEGESGSIARAGAIRGEPAEEVVIRLLAQGRVAGQIRWEDGPAAAGVQIELLGRGPLGAHPQATGPDGRFSIDALPAGIDLTLLAIVPRDRDGARAPREWTRFKLAPGEHKEGLELVLSRRAAWVEGLVVLPAGGPAGGATVLALAERDGRARYRAGGPYRTMSRADGSYRLDGLPNGTYTVWAVDPSHVGRAVAGVPAGARALRLPLGRPAALAGTVVDRAGRPLTSYLLTVSPVDDGDNGGPLRTPPLGPDATEIPVANQQGAFEIGPLAPGKYEITATSADNQAGTLKDLTITAGERRADLRIVTSPLP